MYKLTLNGIRQSAASESTYDRGEEYYLKNKLTQVWKQREGLSIVALVRDAKLYTVTASFRKDGTLEKISCTCPAEGQYGSLCRHMVAVLLYLREHDTEKLAEERKQRVMAQLFRDFADLAETQPRQPLNLEVTYACNYPVRKYDRIFGTLSLRIGEDRLYVVKNISDLIYNVTKSHEEYFGKNFTYQPSYHTFSQEDLRLVNFISELVEMSGNRPERELPLTKALAKRFFRIMEQKPFLLKISGVTYQVKRVVDREIPVAFTLEKKGEKLAFTINNEEKREAVELTDDGEYVFSGDEISHILPEQARRLHPLVEAAKVLNTNELSISKEEREKFFTEIFPQILKLGHVQISPEVQELLLKEDLQTEIYLSRQGEGIGAQVKFIYGQRQINPFDAEDAEPGEKILLRDLQREQEVLYLLDRYGFLVQPGKLYLENEESLYSFFTQGVPSLQELATVYYSEDLKGLTMPKRKVSGGVRFNAEEDLLEFNFGVEGVQEGELADIFAALHEKKRYYRLKDGSFLSLDNPELEKVAELAVSLDLDSRDLAQQFVELPKYRAPYLAQKLEDAGLKDFRQDGAFEQLVESICHPSALKLAPPKSLKPVLRDYQLSGFRWLKTLSHLKLGGILADDMGLGKTVEVLSLLLSEKEQQGAKPSLVIAPTSLLYNWEAETKKFAPGLSALVVSGSKEERSEQMTKIPRTDIVITSYPLIRRDIDDYLKYSFRFCILDEAQQIKNAATQGARAVKHLKAQGRFALTGTPMENSLAELWSLFDFVLPGYLFSSGKFKKRFLLPIMRNKDQAVSEELSRQIRPFVLRRLKKDVLRELPEKIEHQLTAELTDEQKKIYLAYLRQIKGEIKAEIGRKGFAKSQIVILAGLTRLRQICCHPGIFLENYRGQSGKMELLDEVITEARSGGHRILLFSQFTSMLQLIRDHLVSEGIPPFYLDGNTPTQERGRMVSAFNEGEKEVFLISLKAGGTGLNLTGADTVIHFDPWWNPAVEDQATDRAYRIGQDKVVQVIKLITHGTIEEKILSLQQKKKALIDSVIKPGQTLLTKLSEEELWDLFSA
jgi:hypothetical protein